MAFLLPRNIPSRNDIPGRLNLLGRSLRELPDEIIVWLEHDDDGEAYLLVLDPTLSLIHI